MNITSENLVVVTRPSLDDSGEEVLLGRKKRGRFAGYDIFPGGKAEGAALQKGEAARELREETGIELAPDELEYAAKLLIFDERAKSQRFGNVFIYLARLQERLEAFETDEITPRWVLTRSPDVVTNMPPDTQGWWPHVRDFDGDPTVTHIRYDASGGLDIITKKPNFAHDAGQILFEANLPANESQ